ncbi:MAG: 30S ribosomal protein S20 [Bdellovibrionales bacterium]
MATHKSAEKRARQSVRKNAINRKTRSTVRTVDKQMRDLLVKKDKKSAEALLSTFMSVVAKAAQKGAIHTRNAARLISRVSEQVSNLK